MIVANDFSVTSSGAVVVQAFGPNSRRVGLIISVPDTNAIWVKLGATPALDQGIRVGGSNSLPLVLLFDKPNPWITSPVNVQCAGVQKLNLTELSDIEP